MDPIQGTNCSLELAMIAAQDMNDANNLDTARAETVLDTIRDMGSQLVELIEGLGSNIDLYT